MSGNGNQVPLAPSQRGPGPYPFEILFIMLQKHYLRNISQFSIWSCRICESIGLTNIMFSGFEHSFLDIKKFEIQITIFCNHSFELTKFCQLFLRKFIYIMLHSIVEELVFVL